MPKYIRANFAVSGSAVTSITIEEVQQVVDIIDGYAGPPQWRSVRDISEEELREMSIFDKEVLIKPKGQ